jgi:hypothetical protein
MTNKFTDIPQSFYGVLSQERFETDLEEVAGQVKRLGYAILNSGFTNEEMKGISEEFDRTRCNYVMKHGEDRLRQSNEFYTIRAPLTHGGREFRQLATNGNLLSVLNLLIAGTYILNQQNGIINPPKEAYNQGAWHRDLPYQHYISNSPLAMNALYCVDDFTLENGSTFVLPGTHKDSSFPSKGYIESQAIQVEAKAGQYIILDCMIFHSGGFNRTDRERRAVNHVYTIPFHKQQINIPKNMNVNGLSENETKLFGFKFPEPASIEEYLNSRSIRSIP